MLVALVGALADPLVWTCGDGAAEAQACPLSSDDAAGAATNNTAMVATSAAGVSRPHPVRGRQGRGPCNRIETAISVTVIAVKTSQAIQTAAAPAITKYRPVSSLERRLVVTSCSEGRPCGTRPSRVSSTGTPTITTVSAISAASAVTSRRPVAPWVEALMG